VLRLHISAPPPRSGTAHRMLVNKTGIFFTY
jgi:hypothetical protein